MARFLRKPRVVMVVPGLTPPVEITPPIIIGIPTEGSTSARVSASVSGNPVPTLTSFQWYINGVAEGAINTTPVWPVGSALDNATISERWDNSQGFIISTSAPVAIQAATGIAFSTPNPVALTGWVSGVAPDSSLAQTGSRLYYIQQAASTNPSGIDNPNSLAQCQANIMYWNGTNIVDAQGYTSPGGVGTPYGTDPWNPSGTVNVFKTFSSVAPRTNAATDIGGTATALGASNVAPSAMMRSGFADFWMFKRGETIDLTADIAAWNTRRGISATLSGLNLSRGASSTNRHVLGSYGSLALPRPKFIRPTSTTGVVFGVNVNGLNNVLITGIHIDARNRTAGVAITLLNYLNIAAGDNDITFEDVWFQGGRTGLNFGNGGSQETPPDSLMAGGIVLRGCLITDCFRNNSGCNGIFYGGAHGTSRLSLLSCFFARNGLARDPSLRTSFMPDGAEVIPGDTVVSMVGSGTTVVVTTSNAAGTDHGISVGDSVTVSSSSIGAFNGTFTVSATNEAASTFSFANATSGSATGATYTTIYRFPTAASSNRNAYLSGAKDIQNSLIDDCVFLPSASGLQNRSGSSMVGNFIYEGYCGIGATQGIQAPSTTQTGVITDNVLQRFAPPAIANGSIANPGWGFLLGGGLYGTEFTRNVFSQAQNSTRDQSGGGYALALSAYYGDTDEPFHRSTTNVNAHDNVLDAVFDGPTAGPAPSAIYENVASDRLEPYGQFAFPITGNWVAGQVLTCTPLPGYTGTPSYQWVFNNVAIGGETAATHTVLAGELTGANGFRGLRCYVTGVSYAGVNIGIVGCTIANNAISHQTTTGDSKRKAYGIPTGNTAPNSTNTTYTTNRHYATIAAAKAGEGWLDETRTLKSYLQMRGLTITTDDGAQEHYNAVTGMWRGNTDYELWSGRKITNWIRAGRNLPPI